MTEENSLEECVQIMKAYVEAHPDKPIYNGAGFSTSGPEPNAGMLDPICPDKPMICTSNDGHSMWLNTKAMETFGINREAVAKWGQVSCGLWRCGGFPF